MIAAVRTNRSTEDVLENVSIGLPSSRELGGLFQEEFVGATGLAAIHPVTDSGIVRPLIEIERAQIVDFLRERNIPWREDAMNAGLDFARNRIRHQLLHRELPIKRAPNDHTREKQCQGESGSAHGFFNDEMQSSAHCRRSVTSAGMAPNVCYI